tara:strand:+ start:110 stop:280 length:171 start_codon:yes stop_codon:yes gene_type:complete
MKKQNKTKCLNCQNDLLWSNDFDYEDYGMEGEGIVSVYTCLYDKCNTEDIIIYTKC